MPDINLGPAPRILVIRAGALGDCLLMLPVLAALRRHFPGARIEVMGYPVRWAWVMGRGLVDAVHPVERPGMHLLFCEGAKIPTAVQDFFAGYDLILSYRPDPERVVETNLRRLGVPLVLSQAPFPPPPPPIIHVADFALRLIAQIGVPSTFSHPTIHLTADELASAKPFFSAHGMDLSRERLIVLHPGSGGETKRWPLVNFAAVAEMLAAQLAVRVVVVTGFAEAGLGARLVALTPTVPILVAEDWPLIPTAALLAHAAVFVGNDSGLTHLAATLGRPTVAVFGPTDPQIWGPRGPYVTLIRAGAQADHAAGWIWSHNSPAEVRTVVTAVRQWLTRDDLTQSPGDRWGPASHTTHSRPP